MAPASDVTALFRGINDGGLFERRAAIAALARVKPRNDAELGLLLRAARSKGRRRLRAAALASIASLDETAVFLKPHCRGLLDPADRGLRRAALGPCTLLGEIGSAPVLRRLLDGPPEPGESPLFGSLASRPIRLTLARLLCGPAVAALTPAARDAVAAGGMAGGPTLAAGGVEALRLAVCLAKQGDALSVDLGRSAVAHMSDSAAASALRALASGSDAGLRVAARAALADLGLVPKEKRP